MRRVKDWTWQASFNAAGTIGGGVDLAASAADAGLQGADWAASSANDAASDAPNPNNCFLAGTLVQMADGSVKPIEKIVVGDKVATRNIATGKTEIKTVLKKTIRLVHDLIVLHFAEKKHGNEIDHVTATPGHPFYVSGKGFVLAGNLAVGNAIVTRAGPSVYVVQIKRVHSEKLVAVYNFTVQNDHTYFIGTANGGEWVHNTSWTSPGGLRYRSGGPDGNRMMHVFQHLQENPTKIDHGVFNVDTSQELLDLLDEAWARRGATDPADPAAYNIPMFPRITGTEGQAGIRMVTVPGTNSVITAYPR